MKDLKVIIAVDSFKGSATSKEVEDYIENGILRYKKDNISIKKFLLLMEERELLKQ